MTDPTERQADDLDRFISEQSERDPAFLSAYEAALKRRLTSESTAYKVWVVSCRPFVEKIVGGFVETSAPNEPTYRHQVDGTFFLEEHAAIGLAASLNLSHGAAVWKVYPAYLNLQKLAPQATNKPVEECGKQGCGKPAAGHALGSLRYATCDAHRAEIQALVDRE